MVGKKKLVVDEYTDEYIAYRMMEHSMKKWDVRVGHSPTRVIGKKPKYKDANWMP